MSSARTRARRALLGGAALVLPLGSALVCAPSAAADVTTFTDRGDHLTTVRVSHGPTNVRVRAKVGRYKIGSSFTFWLDTDPNDPGPEYKIRVEPNTEVLPLRTVESFADEGKTVTCDYGASADVFGEPFVTIKVPRKCLGKPGKVRVAVRGTFAVPGPDIVDWAPAPRTFGPWVSR